ncbi:ABC transporter ATP-binding protein [Actinosynnema pretiosum]|uniref:ABC transporter n=1 Tax=Actinosynnema pretiosum TaxID=42197 RepID=A0A290Z5L4_9PSEU|nr:ABC transporter ATP-binding protein [Actinosynnema pretiosum]ATE54265.1 ABC transporter [Actinosynnema pretiosum]
MPRTTSPDRPAPPTGTAALALTALTKVHGSGESAVTALDDVSLTLERGTFTAVMGPSGSGKSTFLNCAAGLERPTSGTVVLGGADLSGLDENRLTALRRDRVGFVFQGYNLVPSLDVLRNVELPLLLGAGRVDPAWRDEVVRKVGLTDRLHHMPSQLSGGQQQRVAIARALVTRPDVVFADEPTGALDSRTGKRVLELLRDVVDATGQTVLMVTHDPAAASVADRVVFLRDGRLVDELVAPTAEHVAERMTALGEW